MTKAKFFEVLFSVRATASAGARIVRQDRENGKFALIIRQDRAPNAFVSLHFANNESAERLNMQKYSRWMDEWFASQDARVEEAHAVALELDTPKPIANSIEAMVDIINRSEGKGKGRVVEFPAYSVMAIEADVMVITRDVAKKLRFAVARQTRNHGTQYDMFTLSGVGAYAAEYGDDEAKRIERAKANGHELFFMIKHGVSITAHKRDHEFYLHLVPGQKIMFDKVLMEVRPAANDNLKLEIL